MSIKRSTNSIKDWKSQIESKKLIHIDFLIKFNNFLSIFYLFWLNSNISIQSGSNLIDFIVDDSIRFQEFKMKKSIKWQF